MNETEILRKENERLRNQLHDLELEIVDLRGKLSGCICHATRKELQEVLIHGMKVVEANPTSDIAKEFIALVTDKKLSETKQILIKEAARSIRPGDIVKRGQEEFVCIGVVEKSNLERVNHQP